jgi:hypothetical protein
MRGTAFKGCRTRNQHVRSGIDNFSGGGFIDTAVDFQVNHSTAFVDPSTDVGYLL